MNSRRSFPAPLKDLPFYWCGYVETEFNERKRNLFIGKTFLTSYEEPSAVPASHGYKLSTLVSIHWQLPWHNSNAETPTNQSGDGRIVDTNDTKWFSRSTRNTANVLVVIFGCARPRALIIVRISSPWLNIISTFCEPHGNLFVWNDHSPWLSTLVQVDRFLPFRPHL